MTSPDWVVVAQFTVDTDADLTVNILQGNGIPALRLPVTPTARPYQVLDFIRVLVPPDRGAEAKELLEAE